MDKSILNLESLSYQLERLERQNLTLKCTGLAVLLVLVTLVVMGATQQDQTIKAQRIVLLDANGKTRATLEMAKEEPQLTLLDAEGGRRGILDAHALFLAPAEGGTVLLGSSAHGTSLMLTGSSGPGAVLQVSPTEASLGLVGPGKSGATFSASNSASGMLLTADKANAFLDVKPIGSSLSLNDANGYSSVFGSASLVNPVSGETHQTSAASLMLFDKEKNVIWKAP